MVPKNLSDRINSLFNDIGVFERFYYKKCIMETKAEAKRFLLSEEYSAIKKKIYDLLKSHDKYDLWRKRIFVFLWITKKIWKNSQCMADG